MKIGIKKMGLHSSDHRKRNYSLGKEKLLMNTENHSRKSIESIRFPRFCLARVVKKRLFSASCFPSIAFCAS